MAIAPYISQPLTSNGGADGTLAVDDTSQLLEGARVVMGGRGLEPLIVKIDSIAGATSFTCVNTDDSPVDLSAYTTARSSRVTQFEQRDVGAFVPGTYVLRSGDSMTGPLSVAGLIWAQSGGIKFPDGTIQATAAFLTPPGGSDTQVQFKDGSAFGGDAGFTFNKTTKAVNTGGSIIATASSPLIQAVATSTGAGGTLSGWSDGGRFFLAGYGSTQAGTFLGQNLASSVSLFGFSTTTGMMIGTSVSAPLHLGTADTTRLSFDAFANAAFAASTISNTYNSGGGGIEMSLTDSFAAAGGYASRSRVLAIAGDESEFVARATDGNTNLNIEAHGDQQTGTTFGQTYAGLATINSFGASSMVIGTGDAASLVLGTADTARLKLAAAGGINGAAFTTGISTTSQIIASGHVGIGTGFAVGDSASAMRTLNVVETVTAITTDYRNISSTLFFNPASAASGIYAGFLGQVIPQGANNISGSASGIIGVLGQFDTQGTQTIQFAAGIMGQPRMSSAATFTNAFSVYAHTPIITGGGVITNLYGVFIDPMSAGSSTNFALYYNGSRPTVITGAGHVGIGTDTPSTAWLEISTGAVATTPITKFTNNVGSQQHFITNATPEGAITGNVGDTANDTSAGTYYYKQLGTGNTGWVATMGASGAYVLKAGDTMSGTLTSTVASGSNAIALANGARIQWGTGNSYITGSGTNLVSVPNLFAAGGTISGGTFGPSNGTGAVWLSAPSPNDVLLMGRSHSAAGNIGDTYVRGGDSTGAAVAGRNAYIQGGKAGDAATTGGSIFFQTAAAGSGTTLATRLTIGGTSLTSTLPLIINNTDNKSGTTTDNRWISNVTSGAVIPTGWIFESNLSPGFSYHTQWTNAGSEIARLETTGLFSARAMTSTTTVTGTTGVRSFGLSFTEIAGVYTTTSDINALGASGTGPITLGDTTSWPASGYAVINGVEAVAYTLVDSTHISISLRAMFGTTGTTHANGVPISYVKNYVGTSAFALPDMMTTASGATGFNRMPPRPPATGNGAAIRVGAAIEFDDGNGWIFRSAGSNTMSFAPSGSSAVMSLTANGLFVNGISSFSNTGAVSLGITTQNRGGNTGAGVPINIQPGAGYTGSGGGIGGAVNITGGTGGTSANAGGDVTISGGLAGGATPAGGSILFKTAAVGSGATLATRMSITGQSVDYMVPSSQLINITSTTSSDINSIGTGTGAITVGSTSGWPASGYVHIRRIGDGGVREVVAYTVVSATSISITARALFATSATTFSNGAFIDPIIQIVSKSTSVAPAFLLTADRTVGFNTAATGTVGGSGYVGITQSVSSNFALVVSNTTAGIGSSILGDVSTPASIQAASGNAGNATTAVAGLMGRSRNSGTNGIAIGVLGAQDGTASSGPIDIGVMGMASGGTTYNIGGLFTLGTVAVSGQPYTTAALIADNRAVAAPIFVGMDNGAAVFTIADGGNVSIAGHVSPVTDATYDLGISGTNRWRNLYLSGAISASSVTAPGSNTQVLFNNAGNIGAAAGLTYTSTMITSTVPVTITAGTFATGGNALLVTGTMPNTSSGETGVGFVITSAGTAGTKQAFLSGLLAGGTPAQTLGARLFTQAAGTGTGEWSTTQPGNAGVWGSAYGTTAGHNFGLYGDAGGSTTLNAGIAGFNSDTNGPAIGVIGHSKGGGGSFAQVGGYFDIFDSTTPTFVSAALLVDNRSSTSPIILARDNGTVVFSIADGGNVSIAGHVYPITDATYDLGVSGTNRWRNLYVTGEIWSTSGGFKFPDNTIQTTAATATGTNTGDVTIGTANGLSLAGQVLSLAAAGSGSAGAVTTGAQTIAGAKTLTGTLFVNLDGSTSAAAIQLGAASDPNTGFYKPALDEIGIVTGGSTTHRFGSNFVQFKAPTGNIAFDARTEASGASSSVQATDGFNAARAGLYTDSGGAATVEAISMGSLSATLLANAQGTGEAVVGALRADGVYAALGTGGTHGAGSGLEMNAPGSTGLVAAVGAGTRMALQVPADSEFAFETVVSTAVQANLRVIQKKTTTTTAASTDLVLFTSSGSKAYIVEVRAVARRTGGTGGSADDSIAQVWRVRAKRSGGVLTKHDETEDAFSSKDSTWGVNGFSTSGDDLVLVYSGALNNNITWTFTIFVQEV